MKKIAPILLTGFLLLGTAACSSTPKTDAGSGTGANTQSSDNSQLEDNTQANTQNSVGENQPSSDNITGGDMQADGNLAIEVSDKLKTNLPNSNLNVETKNGIVTVKGTVPSQADLDQIQPLAKDINGVQTVEVLAKVAQAQ